MNCSIFPTSAHHDASVVRKDSVRFRPVLSAVVLLALLPAAVWAAGPLFLPRGQTTLDGGSAEATRKELVSAGKTLLEDTTKDVWIVQYDSEQTPASAIRGLVAESGATLLSPVAGGAYLVRATKAQQLAILESGQIEATRPYAPADKGVPAADGAKGFAGGAEGEAIYVVCAFSDTDSPSLCAKVAALDGCELLDGEHGRLRVRMTPTGHAAVTALPEVEAVGEWKEPTIDNNVAVRALHVESIWPSRRSLVADEPDEERIHSGGTVRAGAEDLFTKGLLTVSGEDASRGAALQGDGASRMTGEETRGNSGTPLGLTGKGQIVAVCDSGLDTGDFKTLHPDVRGRVLKTFAYARPGDWSDLNGHGTHVVGSVLGNGSASKGAIRGVAYEAELLFQSCGGGSGSGLKIPNRILDDACDFRTRDGNSPRIHSNSWGASSEGEYNEKSSLFDLGSFICPDFLMLVASGNDGVDEKEPFGVVDPGSVGAPASAKNCLTVGSCENFRPDGYWHGSTYGDVIKKGGKRLWCHEPIASDPFCAPPPGRPNARGMAASSSRGPCKDGRIKPDVVAPGQEILSMRAATTKEDDRTYRANPRYCFKNGTSMATPLVAGTAALVRQWLVERKGVADPDAATLKALICAGAKSLAPGQYGTGEKQEIPFRYPNNVEGWGMVDLENTVANPDGVAFRDGEVIEEGRTRTYGISVPGGKPLCILMAYSDAPATSFSGGLINDLDLTVTDPSGKLWHPNSKNGPDRVNNVEGVRWASAPAGVYTVTVRAKAVPKPMDRRLTNGREDATRFSLVANGAKEIR